MTKHRGLSLALAIILVLVLTVSVFADGDATTSYTVTVPSDLDEKIGNGGLKGFSLNVEPSSVKVDRVTGFVCLQGKKEMNWPNQFEYTLTVPTGTESVTIKLVSASSDSFFLEEEPNKPKLTAIASGVSSIPEGAITETTIALNDGKGSSKLVFPYQKNVKGKYSYASSNVFRFVVVTASPSYTFSSDLPEETYYTFGDTASPLSVAVDAENVTYQWFSGGSAASINQEITGATRRIFPSLASHIIGSKPRLRRKAVRRSS